MKNFIKPSGIEVEVNENSIDAAIALGWKEKGTKEEKKEIIKPVSKKKSSKKA